MKTSCVNCIHCSYEFEFEELPWGEDDYVDKCPSCEKGIYVQPVIYVKHKIAESYDEIDYAFEI